MIRVALFIGILLLTTGYQSQAAILQKISKSEDRDSVQIFFSFDQVPSFDTQLNGKRLDIILEQTLIDEAVSWFETDDKIVKTLTRPVKEDTELSLFFRYTPQKTSFTQSGNTLVADILLGNRFTKTYRNLSSSLKGVTFLERSTRDFANPLVASPYAHDWKTYFDSFESEVTISAPVRFFVPDFPIIRLFRLSEGDGVDLLSEDLLTIAGKGMWTETAEMIAQQLVLATDEQNKKLLALTYGEILMRGGNYEGSYKQLYLLKNNYPDEQIGQFAAYLLGLLLAVNGDPYSANYELRLLMERMTRSVPLYAYANILLSETYLATNQLEKLKDSISRDDIGYPDEIEHRRELRQADYYYATNQPVKAYVAYKLIKNKLDLYETPYSLNGLCETLYKQKSFAAAEVCYEQLSELTDTREQLGMAYFRSAMARLKTADDRAELISDFSRIEDAFPGTEAGFRAAVKKTDLRYLSRNDWTETALRYYNALAEKSDYREVSAESYLKEALLYHFSGNNSTAIGLLSALLRNYRSGPVRPHAFALLIQILPDELERLVEEEQYTEALTLARQHRKLFENNWLDRSLLSGLAHSYHQLGIYSDAIQLYLYIVEISGPEEKEHYFLPLTQLAFDKADYSLVQDYANQYDFHYPKGTYKEEILFLQLKSLLAENKIEQAIGMIPDILPDRDDYNFLAAELFFRKDDYGRVVSILKPYYQRDTELEPSMRFILAESLFHLEQVEQSLPLYQNLIEKDRYSSQSRYRLAQISRMYGDEEQAVKHISGIAASDSEGLWKKLAERELKFKQLTDTL